MKIVCIGFLALGIALAVLATGGIAALLLSSANLPLVSFSAVIFALAFSTLAGMIGIIGLARAGRPNRHLPQRQNPPRQTGAPACSTCQHF